MSVFGVSELLETSMGTCRRRQVNDNGFNCRRTLPNKSSPLWMKHRSKPVQHVSVRPHLLLFLNVIPQIVFALMADLIAVGARCSSLLLGACCVKLPLSSIPIFAPCTQHICGDLQLLSAATTNGCDRSDTGHFCKSARAC